MRRKATKRVKKEIPSPAEALAGALAHVVTKRRSMDARRDATSKTGFLYIQLQENPHPQY